MDTFFRLINAARWWKRYRREMFFFSKRHARGTSGQDSLMEIIVWL